LSGFWLRGVFDGASTAVLVSDGGGCCSRSRLARELTGGVVDGPRDGWIPVFNRPL